MLNRKLSYFKIPDESRSLFEEIAPERRLGSSFLRIKTQAPQILGEKVIMILHGFSLRPNWREKKEEKEVENNARGKER